MFGIKHSKLRSKLCRGVDLLWIRPQKLADMFLSPGWDVSKSKIKKIFPKSYFSKGSKHIYLLCWIRAIKCLFHWMLCYVSSQCSVNSHTLQIFSLIHTIDLTKKIVIWWASISSYIWISILTNKVKELNRFHADIFKRDGLSHTPILKFCSSLKILLKTREKLVIPPQLTSILKVFMPWKDPNLPSKSQHFCLKAVPGCKWC